MCQGSRFSERPLYDGQNQIRYKPLPHGTLREGFMTSASAPMGKVLVFTPKRLGHVVEKERWLAVIEGGEWVGASRAAFDDLVVAQNESLADKPVLLTIDPFGEGRMLVVRPTSDDWRAGLVTGTNIGSTIEYWIA
jgi:glycine cleavage system H protein